MFASDIQLCSTIERVRRLTVSRCKWLGWFDWLRRCLWFCVTCQTFPAAFTAKAAFAYATKASSSIHHVGAIDPNDARSQFRRDIERKVDVFRPDRCGKAIARVVRDFDSLGWRAECCRGQNWSKDFFLHQCRCGRQASDQCWGIETAFGCCDLIGFAFCISADHLGDLVQLNRVHDGANVDAFVERITDAQPVHPGLEFGVEPISDAFLDQQARSGAAYLSLIEPNRVNQPFDRAVDVGIVEYNVGGFAAQFER